MSYPYFSVAPGPFPNGSMSGGIIPGIISALGPITDPSNPNSGVLTLYYAYVSANNNLFMFSVWSGKSKTKNNVVGPFPNGDPIPSRDQIFGYWNDSSDFGIGDTIIAYNPPTEVYPTISSPTLGTFTFRTKSIPVKKVVNNIYYVYETSSSKLYMYRQIPILRTLFLISG